MSNLHTNIFTIEKFDRKMFIDFLNLDSDFEEDAIGFSELMFNELETSILAMAGFGSNQDKIDALYHVLENATSLYANDSQFILGNQVYTEDYSIQVHVSDKDLNNENLTLKKLMESATIFVAWVQ